MRRNLIRKILLGGIRLQDRFLNPRHIAAKRIDMRKIIDIAALSIAVCILVMVLFLPSPVLSFKCYRGDGVSCAQLGRDKLSRGDYDGAKLAFIRACKARDDDSCFELASIYDGEGNAAQAGIFYAAACDKNVAVACHKLGNLYRQGRLSRDLAAAARSMSRPAIWATPRAVIMRPWSITRAISGLRWIGQRRRVFSNVVATAGWRTAAIVRG